MTDMQPFLLRIAIFLGVLLVALYGFTQLVRRTSMFFPDKFPTGDWNTTASDVTFRTDDGIQLHGWLFRAAGAHAAAVDFAGTLGQGKLALYGESLGGPYAAYAATLRSVHCVIIENSFPSLAALGNALYHPIPLGWFAPRAMTTLRWLNIANVPVLVMHGRRDQVIPFALGQTLFKGLTVRKEMLVSETAGHCEIPFVEKDRYYDAVVRFCCVTDKARSYPMDSCP